MDSKDAIQPVPTRALANLASTAQEVGGPYEPPPDEIGAVARTMFDTPHSRDNLVVALTPPEFIEQLPSQSMVRIRSKDRRTYIGIVVEGPFAEPDGLRADAPIVVSTTVRGIFMPRYHGRVHIEVLREEMQDGATLPPRFRPIPNSPVFALTREETMRVLRLIGDIQIGFAIGHDRLPVQLSSFRKSVLPRHLAILGTTGGGKSTTVGRLLHQFQKAGIATLIFDTEGEYTEIDQPTQDPNIQPALKYRGMAAEGVQRVRVMHLYGRETTSPKSAGDPALIPFGLAFEDLSASAVMEILGLNEAQTTRYLVAYDTAKALLRQFKIFPGNTPDDDQQLAELDELERGYPKLTLQRLYDVVSMCAHVASGGKAVPLPRLYDTAFQGQANEIYQVISSSDPKPTSQASWRTLQGRLGRLRRMNIFDNPRAPVPDYAKLLQPGMVTVIDLSDTDSPEINNLVIASLLRGVQLRQDHNYEEANRLNKPPQRAMVIIEEAHEFLSEARIRQMPVLFQQVARIARRGRKRWLGLAFVTQLPQHLPDEVLGLVNNFILHKIGDANVISHLKRSIGGIDDALWDRLRNLAPGQAVVSLTSMGRPLLVAIDPAPCKLRMVD